MPARAAGRGDTPGNVSRPAYVTSLSQRGFAMLWTIAIVILILWLLGFSLDIAGGLIHLLLIVALVVIVVQFLRGRRGV